MKRVLADLAAAVCGVALLPAMTGAAVAAADHTGPTITMQSTGHLLTKAGPIVNIGSAHPDEVYETQVEARWSGSDPSGICDYQVWNDSGRDSRPSSRTSARRPATGSCPVTWTRATAATTRPTS